MKKDDGEIVKTTRLDEEGDGVPEAVVLGKGKRIPRGWELCLLGKLPKTPVSIILHTLYQLGST